MTKLRQLISLALPLGAAVLALSSIGCATAADARITVSGPTASCDARSPEHKEQLRVATYNIQSTKSSSLDAIAEVLGRLDADIIALQEVQRGVKRGAPEDQAQALAAKLGMFVAYAPAKKKGAGDFGIAVLSRLPIVEAQRIPLRATLSGEPRVALDTQVCVGDHPLRFVAVHNDVLPWSGTSQSAHVAELVAHSVGDGVIVAGDFNASPHEEAAQNLKRAGLVDVIADLAEGPTFPGTGERVDYLFVDNPLARLVRKVRIEHENASDHFPVVAEIDVDAWLGR